MATRAGRKQAGAITTCELAGAQNRRRLEPSPDCPPVDARCMLSQVSRTLELSSCHGIAPLICSRPWTHAGSASGQSSSATEIEQHTTNTCEGAHQLAWCSAG